MRLVLVGDAESLDVLAELGSRLGYDEIHRLDEVAPALPFQLSAEDHVVVGTVDARRRRDLMARVLSAGDAGYLGLCASEHEGLVALLQLSADRVPKAKLDRVSAPVGTSGAVTAAEQAIVIAADLVAVRRRRIS
jgi:xanthine/CO dehydrogenase XdhC/CoxF family maturation factor